MSCIDFDAMKVTNAQMSKVLATINQVAGGVGTLLFSGEVGTGKSALAHYAHSRSRRQRLVSIDCRSAAELPEVSGKDTLLLDNIDSSSIGLQKAILELFNRSEQDRPRVLATTRRDLKQLVKSEQFRQDLFYKIAVIHLEIPSLRSRLEDFSELATFMIDVYGIIHGKTLVKVTKPALEKLMQWPWPGNIRELENVIERAVILTQGGLIDEGDIRLEPFSEEIRMEFRPGMSLSEVEKRLILQTLELTAHNRTKAAHLLGISIRTLRNKLNEYREGGVL